VLVERSLGAEGNSAFDQGEQRVVLADADVTPGWNWVPRWRTMIEPALISSPPKRFTPSILGLESRPFRVEPPPFFCAMECAP